MYKNIILIWLIFVAIIIAGCIQNIEDRFKQKSTSFKNGGVLRGRVAIGPLCPVEPCSISPEEGAKVYRSRKVIIYEVTGKTKIAEININRSGEYNIFIKPNKYIVDISDAEGNALPLDLSKRQLIGTTVPKEVEVITDKETIADFDIDTGIR